MNLCQLRVSILLLVAAILVPLSPAYAQDSVFSFVGEDGVRVFTNIPPKTRVQEELKVIPALAIPPQPSEQPRQRSAYNSLIEKYASQYRLDPSLIHSMIATESGFNHRAVSPKGAQGLMQLMPTTARRIGVRNPFDPEENIRGGVKHMRTLLDTFDNNLVLSLAAYNAGETLVQRIGRVPNIRETRDYIQSITRRYGKRQMSINPEQEQPRTFRFLDQRGVLHLTNIPPRAQSYVGFSTRADGGQSAQ